MRGINNTSYAPANVSYPWRSPFMNPVNNTASRVAPASVPGNLSTPQQARSHAAHHINLSTLIEHLREKLHTGWGDKIKAWFAEGSRANAGLPEDITLNMPGGGGSLTLESAAFTAMIKSLPRLARAQARADLVPRLEARLQNGHNILSSLQQGQMPASSTAQDVADLTLLLQTVSFRQGQGFVQGAYNINDPQGMIYNYLNSCPDKYLRGSSHLEDTQNARIDGHANMHRGIDTPRGLDGLLFGLRTTTFGAIPASGGNGQRLFFKAETQGCFINNKTLHFHQRHDARDSIAGHHKLCASDFTMSFMHAMSFLETRGQGSAIGTRKERIPDAVQDSFRNTLRRMEQDAYRHPTTGARMIDILNRNDPLNLSQGVHTIMNNLRDAYALVQGSPARVAMFEHNTEELRDALSHITNIDHLDARIGNEMVLDLSEALSPVGPTDITSTMKLVTINNYIGI